MPYSYYHWGMYYRNSLFRRVGADSSTTWDALIRTCDRLNHTDSVPLAIAPNHPWTAAAWFDWINLPLNGMWFDRDVIAEKLSFTPERIRAMREHWKTLLERECFPTYEIESANDDLGKQWMTYIGTMNAWSWLNNRIGKISTNGYARIAADYFMRKAANLLDEAHGLSQYVDREVPQKLARGSMERFRPLMEHRNFERALEQPERVRPSLLRKRTE